MEFHYTVYQPDGTKSSHTWQTDSEQPGYHAIKAVVLPLIGDSEHLEHVTVLHKGKRADMFVAETGALVTPARGPLPVNDCATKIYRAAEMRRNPGMHPERLPAVYGPAVLFDERVWF